MSPQARLRAGLVLALVMAAAGSALAASLEVQPTAATTALALNGDGTSTSRIVKIAELTIVASGVRGCRVWIAGGSLVRSGGAALPFEVVVAARGSPAPPATAFTVGEYRFATTAPITSVDVYIKYRPAALQGPGSYTASVAIDAVDN
jgi:hypothetical protein